MSLFDQLKETVLGAERDSMWLLDEETGHPTEVPLASVAHEMTPLQVAMPTPPSGASGREGDRVTESPCEGVLVPVLRKPGGGRRRQLVFADPEVQISEKAMKEQIVNPHAETLSMSEVLLDLPSVKTRASPAQLFSAPCGSALHHDDLLSLWKQCALLTALPGLGRGEQEEEEEEEARGGSEQDREILRTERKRRHSSLREISSESGLQPAEGSSVLDVMLDVAKEDRSIGDVITPNSRWSPYMEAQPPMEPIAEENVEMPEAQTDTESRDMLSWISSGLQRFGKVPFDSLVSREDDRTTAAHTLYKLLELLSAGHVTVQQTEPYSDITVNSAA